MIDASIVARLVKEVEELLNHVTNENFEAAVDTARVLQQANLGKQFPPKLKHDIYLGKFIPSSFGRRLTS